MIVKNEEASLPTCLTSVADLFHEIVIVDTGSTDRTIEVALGFGAQVHHFVWADDFSAARNEGLRHATGDWIFWLDGDEYLDAANRQRLRELFARLGAENAAYVMTQMCLAESALQGEAGPADKPIEQVRLFRNHPQIRWQHRVYEQILPAVRRLGGALHKTSVVIQHPGYRDPLLHRRKIERNLMLAEREHRDHPDDPYVLYTLGVFQQKLGQPAESLRYLQPCVNRRSAAATYGPKAHALLAQGYQQTGAPQQALAAYRAGRRQYPADGELICQEAMFLRAAGDQAGAEACLRAALREQAGAVMRHCWAQTHILIRMPGPIRKPATGKPQPRSNHVTACFPVHDRQERGSQPGRLPGRRPWDRGRDYRR